MLRRDFTKSNAEYLKSNRNFILAVSLFLLVGILVFAIFGMNTNFEIKGYNEFSVVVTEAGTRDFSEHKSEIGSIINSYDGKFDSLSIYAEGDDTKYVVRYMNNISEENILEINSLIAEKLEVDVSKVSQHTNVGATVETKDYVFTVLSVLAIIVLVTIFCYARYNGASSMAVLLGCILGSIGFISFGSILRLSVGLNYLGMIVILNLLIAYLAINLFETMHKSSWLASGDFSQAIETGLKSSKFRTLFISIALLLIGLIMILITPLTIKHVAVNIMFMAVTILAVTLYIIPFFWNALITRCRKREYKVRGNNSKVK